MISGAPLTLDVIDGERYARLVIRSTRGKETEAIWDGTYVKSLDRNLQRASLRKLEAVHAAEPLNDLRVPPGNRLEQLEGDRKGQHSVRVNDQWRICFKWNDGAADDVELVDYHT